jgi:hypothetical protein
LDSLPTQNSIHLDACSRENNEIKKGYSLRFNLDFSTSCLFNASKTGALDLHGIKTTKNKIGIYNEFIFPLHISDGPKF